MKFSAFIAAILLTVGFVACGGDSEGGDMDTTVVDTVPAPAPMPEPTPAPTTGDSAAMSDSAMHDSTAH